MRVFDFDGTIYDGESLFDLYLYSARHDPKVFRYIAPVRGTQSNTSLAGPRLNKEYGVGKMTEGYLTGTEPIQTGGERRTARGRLLGPILRTYQALVPA